MQLHGELTVTRFYCCITAYAVTCMTTVSPSLDTVSFVNNAQDAQTFNIYASDGSTIALSNDNSIVMYTRKKRDPRGFVELEDLFNFVNTTSSKWFNTNTCLYPLKIFSSWPNGTYIIIKHVTKRFEKGEPIFKFVLPTSIFKTKFITFDGDVKLTNAHNIGIYKNLVPIEKDEKEIQYRRDHEVDDQKTLDEDREYEEANKRMEEAKKRMGEAKWNTLMEKVKEKNKKEEEEEERKANEGKESSEDGDDHDDNDGNKYGDGDGVEDPREQQEYDPREQQEDVPWNPNNIICPPDFAKRERYHLLVTIQPLPKQESLAWYEKFSKWASPFLNLPTHRSVMFIHVKNKNSAMDFASLRLLYYSKDEYKVEIFKFSKVDIVLLPPHVFFQPQCSAGTRQMDFMLGNYVTMIHFLFVKKRPIEVSENGFTDF